MDKHVHVSCGLTTEVRDDPRCRCHQRIVRLCVHEPESRPAGDNKPAFMYLAYGLMATFVRLGEVP